jgi:hypothetical protein
MKWPMKLKDGHYSPRPELAGRPKTTVGDRTLAVAPVTWTRGGADRLPTYSRRSSFEINLNWSNPGYPPRHSWSLSPSRRTTTTIHEFAEFRQVLEVQSTAKQLGNDSIETRVTRRVAGKSTYA